MFVWQLSGIALDADCPAGMHAAFERLKRRAALACVRGVVALRAARWGTAEPEPAAPPPDLRRRYNYGGELPYLGTISTKADRRGDVL